MQSLKKENNSLANTSYQIEILENIQIEGEKLPSFSEKLQNVGFSPLKPDKIDIFQINIGKMCNQTCKHCHVDAGPDRKEMMTKEHLQQCLNILENTPISTVDITGGAPEMHPHFRWFVEECYKLGKKIIVRCNLTILVANPKYYDLPAFYAKHQVEIVSSLPFYNARRTDSQRGKGVFDNSIKALKMLNKTGYGREGTSLSLHLVYNPTGAFLPASQVTLEKEFKKILLQDFGIHFNHLFTITNMPISRFLEYLLQSGNYETYMDKLIEAFNPAAVAQVMCRNTISISWDGYLYDCDFNQMLDIKADKNTAQHIDSFDFEKLSQRCIQVNQHCFGCTAGAGSSCQGATT